MVGDLIKKHKDKVINFGAFGYTNEEMSIILDVDVSEIDSQMNDTNSPFYKSYKRGDLISDYKFDIKLMEMAQSGDLAALAKFEMRKKKRQRK